MHAAVDEGLLYAGSAQLSIHHGPEFVALERVLLYVGKQLALSRLSFLSPIQSYRLHSSNKMVFIHKAHLTNMHGLVRGSRGLEQEIWFYVGQMQLEYTHTAWKTHMVNVWFSSLLAYNHEVFTTSLLFHYYI